MYKRFLRGTGVLLCFQLLFFRMLPRIFHENGQPQGIAPTIWNEKIIFNSQFLIFNYLPRIFHEIVPVLQFRQCGFMKYSG